MRTFRTVLVGSIALIALQVLVSNSERLSPALNAPAKLLSRLSDPNVPLIPNRKES